MVLVNVTLFGNKSLCSFNQIKMRLYWSVSESEVA